MASPFPGIGWAEQGQQGFGTTLQATPPSVAMSHQAAYFGTV